ncbi:MAG: hypothetical protein WCG05_00880 [Alphaproteobacteria bacterium]
MYKIIVFLFCLLGFSAQAISRIDDTTIPDEPRLTDITIIVSSCDRYSEFWAPFSELLMRYWPSLKTYNKDIPILFIVNKKPFSFDRVQVVSTGEDGGWSRNMLQALKQVKTKYVLYMQEDYFLSQTVDEKYLSYLLTKMKQQDIAYIETNNGSFYAEKYPYPLVKGTEIKGKHVAFRASLQSALWNKDILEWLIKPKENAWDFEANASIRSEGLQNPFLVVTPGYFPITFVNACHVGFWNAGALDLLKKEGIPVQVQMPVDSNYEFTLWLMNKHRKIYKQWIKVLRLFDPKLRRKKT